MIPRMVVWELLVVWVTIGSTLGVLGGLAFGSPRVGVVVGIVAVSLLGSLLELLQRRKDLA